MFSLAARQTYRMNLNVKANIAHCMQAYLRLPEVLALRANQVWSWQFATCAIQLGVVLILPNIELDRFRLSGWVLDELLGHNGKLLTYLQQVFRFC